MKFLLTASGMKEVTDPSLLEKAHEKFQGFADYVNGKETEYVFHPFWDFIQDIMISLGHWIVTNLPEIMGYSTILCAICIVICSFTSSQSMIKPIGLWAVATIIAICILGGV